MRIEPGPGNAITDVAGILVGQAEARDRPTGVTVVLAEAPAIAAADIRGGGPAARATEGVTRGGGVGGVDAVVLSGGSAFGLDALGGATEALAAMGRGFEVGAARVPIVIGAALFDLLITGADPVSDPAGDPADDPADGPVGGPVGGPWRALGAEAVRAARPGPVAEGNAGAGLGATVGSGPGAIKGGTGTASLTVGPWTVGAIAAANPQGSVTLPGSRAFWAWPLERGAEFGAVPPPAGPLADLDHGFPGEARPNTTLAVAATDAALTKDEAHRFAVMAQAGLARAIRPVHGPLDGDIVFALATGRGPSPEGLADLARLGMLAGDCVARAIARGVYRAEALGGVPAWRDLDDAKA